MNQIIIYGAGRIGDGYYNFLKANGYGNIVYGFCDQNWAEIKNKSGKPVISLDEAKIKEMPFLIGVGSNLVGEVKKIFEEKDINNYYDDLISLYRNHLHTDTKNVYRDFCAFYHEDHMEDYYQKAEIDYLSQFWGGTCKELFEKLNKNNIVELACGHGRHVPQYINDSEHITLVDILEKNIEFCRKRFNDFENISYYKNNGYDLEKLANDTYTALFTYDAMVHFELLDIANYLKETYRILKRDSMALFHHSNYHSDYKAAFSTAPGGRSFMSKEIFAYLAYRAGFEIIDQRVLSFNKFPDLDCLTLVKKN